MSGGSSTSWVVPFVLGAASAASLFWISHHVSQKNTSNDISSKPNKAQSSSSSSNKNDNNATTQLMDSVELDNRVLRKAEAVLRWRTTRLVLVVERCTNDHNYSAILRTAEALGIQNVYMIDPPPILDEEERLASMNQQQRKNAELQTPEEAEARRQHHLFAQKATEWLTVKDFATSQDCVKELKQEGYQLWVTDLGQEAQSLTLTSPTIPEKVALVMGTEAVGCSQYMLDEADKRVYLPLRGFADSLNLSVATALILHQLFVMDPTLIGAIPETQKTQLRQAWYAKLCSNRILTNQQRKQRLKLQKDVQKCQAIHERSLQRPLMVPEQKKLEQWETYKQELAALDALVDPAKLKAAVQGWVENPPQPLTDVRRADAHRVCFVGKGTKGKHQEHWKDMVATSNQPSAHLSSATAFREKVNQAQTSNTTT